MGCRRGASPDRPLLQGSAGEWGSDSGVLPLLTSRWWNNSVRDRCGARTTRRELPVSRRGVELGHELAVGGACGREVLIAFGELQAQIDALLLEVADLLVEGVEVDRDAEPGLAPGLLAECFGQAGLQLPDPAGQPDGSFAGGEQVGVQRGAVDARPLAGPGRRWGCLQGVDLAEQVAVAVEETAIDPGGTGDARGADLGPVGGGAVERGKDALASPRGIGLPALSHCCGALAVLGGGSVVGHAVASGQTSGAVARVLGMPRNAARWRRITVTASSMTARSVSLAWPRSPSMRPMSRRIRVISCWLGVASARAHSSTPSMAAARRSRVCSRSSRLMVRSGR